MPDVNEDETDSQWMRIQAEARAEEGEVTQAEREEMGQLLERQITEARRQQQELDRKYPYMDGGATVLGPEVFAKGGVLCWKGQNYVPQEYEQTLRTVRTVAGIHCGALLELLHDAGIRLPDNALRVYQLLRDELTLTMPALAENHPAVVPRLPEGME
jgi:hypothetical protein